ncbi:MAG: hypothetical protein WCJ64_16070 [Rhodospirillaceae bacterium]
MRKLAIAVAIVLIALMQAEAFAQDAPPAYTLDRQVNLTGVLAITGGGLGGLFASTVISQEMLSIESLAVIGVSGLAIIGATAGAMAGYKLFTYVYQ